MPKSSRRWTTTSTRSPSACELAFLNKGIRIQFEDERSGKKHEFQYEGGIASFVKYLNQNKTVLHPEPIYHQRERDRMVVETAIQYNDGYVENVFSFVNNINTVEGGTHLIGFRAALTSTINSYAEREGLNKSLKDISLSGDDVREGLTAVEREAHDPQFEGQTKGSSARPKPRASCSRSSARGFRNYFEENPAVARKIVEKCIQTARAREAAKARDLARRKSILDGARSRGSSPTASRRIPPSARSTWSRGFGRRLGQDGARPEVPGNPAAEGQDPERREGLADKMLSNEEIRTIITALGTGIDDDFDADKARYHKIIIMTDADVDGAHIRTLLLTFFFRHMRPLIERGYIYIAMPPLYRIAKGKDVRYAYNDAEREKALEEIGRKGIHLQRYKDSGR